MSLLPPQQAPQSYADRFAMNPWTQMGLGILAANRPGASFGEAVGGGLLGGIQNLQAMRQQQYANQVQQMKMAQAQALAEQAEQDRLLQEQQRAQQLAWMQQNAPELINAPPEYQKQAIAAQFRETPDWQQKYDWLLANPDKASMLSELGAVGGKSPGQTNVYLPKQLTEEAKVVGKAYGQDFVDMQRAAREASTSNARLDRLGSLLDKTYTGAGAEAVLSAKRAGQMLGIEMSGVGEAESARALANEMALQLRNPAGGAGMPGALSDKDREFLQSMTPQLTTTPEGRSMMIETRKRLNNRNIEVAKMARRYRQQQGALDEGFFNVLQEYSDANPLFEDIGSADVKSEASPEIESILKKYPPRNR